MAGDYDVYHRFEAGENTIKRTAFTGELRAGDPDLAGLRVIRDAESGKWREPRGDEVATHYIVLDAGPAEPARETFAFNDLRLPGVIQMADPPPPAYWPSFQDYRPLADLRAAREESRRQVGPRYDDEVAPVGPSEWARLCQRFGQRQPIRLPDPPPIPPLDVVHRRTFPEVFLMALVVIAAVVMLGRFVTVAARWWL